MKKQVNAYVDPAIFSRLPELVAFFQYSSVSSLIEKMLAHWIEEMDRAIESDRKVVSIRNQSGK